MDNTRLADVMRSPRLPTPPKLAFRILQLVETEEVAMSSLADTIAADPALAAKILRTANSGLYGRVRGVARLQDALMVIGLRNVKTIALGFSLIADLTSAGADSGLDYAAFWRRSLVAACASKAFAARLAPTQREEAFLGGLMHAIGAIVLDRAFGEAYGPAALELGRGVDRYLEAERGCVGLVHVEVGGTLAESWNLPPALTACIAHYADPSRAGTSLEHLVRCVQLGATCGDVALPVAPGPALATLLTLAAEYGFAEGESRQLAERSLEDAARWEKVFDRDMDELVPPAEILARATEALLDLSLQSALHDDAGSAENLRLINDVLMDPLTGLPNRRRLHAFLAEEIPWARRYGKPLSVVELDIDHFTRVNESHGRDAGDLVLQHVATCIRNAIRGADFVARLESAEFVAVLPATDSAGAMQSAERLRSLVARTPARLADGSRVAVTVSAGVATLMAGVQAEGLLRAAERAMHAAKAAGRNAVLAA